MFLLSLLSLIHARPDCNEAMRMRGIMPARGAIAPTDGRIWFATVGTGEANHFTLSITQEGNSAPITGQIETSWREPYRRVSRLSPICV